MEKNLKNDVINTAENFTKNFSDKGNFDYSVESLLELDDLLDELSDYEIDEDTLQSISSMAGCYIFEVARRNYGGEYYWYYLDIEPQDNVVQEKYISNISILLKNLWSFGYKAVAACDFEEELPRKGGYKL